MSRFWEEKPLDRMNRTEWESLCDGCGKCCLHKLEDEETGEVFPTNVACRLLDRKNAQCMDYPNRRTHVPDCVRLTPAKLGTIDWLPMSCAYRLVADGKPLPDWHHLVSGSRETVHAAGMSTRGWTVSEDDAGNSNIISSIVNSEPSFAAPDGARALVVRRSARARRMRLAVDPRDGIVRLTLPSRANVAAAYAWVESKRAWIEATLATLPAPVPLAIGAEIPFEGSLYRLAWREGAARRVAIEGDAIVVGGPEELAAARALRWLRAEALSRLRMETIDLARVAGVRLGRVGIGDARTRWGSCTATGDIRYSWRLILAPAEVRRATVAHEVAHLLHMDHSPAFHAAVARLYGRDPKPERAWLRANGSRLHAFARG